MAPEVLNTVRVNVAFDVFDGMVNNLVNVFFAQPSHDFKASVNSSAPGST